MEHVLRKDELSQFNYREFCIDIKMTDSIVGLVHNLTENKSEHLYSTFNITRVHLFAKVHFVRGDWPFRGR